MQLQLVPQHSKQPAARIEVDEGFTLTCPGCGNDGGLMLEGVDFSPAPDQDTLTVTTILSCDACFKRFGVRLDAHGGTTTLSVCRGADFDATDSIRVGKRGLVLEWDRGRRHKKVRSLKE